jgi:hypothetical protein
VHLHGFNQDRQSRREGSRVPHRLRQLREHLLFQELAPLLEGFAHHVATREHHDVEYVVDDRSRCRPVLLQGVERRTALFVECNHLTVDDRVVRHVGERIHDARVSDVEVVVVPRSQVNGPIALERNRAIAVELQLVQPSRIIGQRIRLQQQHRLDETC